MKTSFIEVMGDYPINRVITFLYENDRIDWDLKEIASQSGVGYSTLKKLIPRLLKYRILKCTRQVGKAKLYKWDDESDLSKKLSSLIGVVSMEAMDLEISSQKTSIQNNQQSEKARTRKGNTILTDEVSTPEISLAINGDVNSVDKDALTKTSSEASRIDGCRLNPQDDPGKASGADNGDTGHGTFPADSKSKSDVEDSLGE